MDALDDLLARRASVDVDVVEVDRLERGARVTIGADAITLPVAVPRELFLRMGWCVRDGLTVVWRDAGTIVDEWRTHRSALPPDAARNAEAVATLTGSGWSATGVDGALVVERRWARVALPLRDTKRRWLHDDATEWSTRLTLRPDSLDVDCRHRDQAGGELIPWAGALCACLPSVWGDPRSPRTLALFTRDTWFDLPTRAPPEAVTTDGDTPERSDAVARALAALLSARIATATEGAASAAHVGARATSAQGIPIPHASGEVFFATHLGASSITAGYLEGGPDAERVCEHMREVGRSLIDGRAIARVIVRRPSTLAPGADTRTVLRTVPHRMLAACGVIETEHGTSEIAVAWLTATLVHKSIEDMLREGLSDVPLDHDEPRMDLGDGPVRGPELPDFTCADGARAGLRSMRVVIGPCAHVASTPLQVVPLEGQPRSLERGERVDVAAGRCLCFAYLRSLGTLGGEHAWSSASLVAEIEPGNAPLVDGIAAALRRVEWRAVATVDDDDW